MDENELDNVNTEVDTTEDGADGGLIALILAAAAGIYFGVRYFFLKKKLKEEREKNAAFQEVIKEHQAEIDVLTSEKERQEYLVRLYEEYISKMEK